MKNITHIKGDKDAMMLQVQTTTADIRYSLY